jgi:hypothetical protein
MDDNGRKDEGQGEADGSAEEWREEEDLAEEKKDSPPQSWPGKGGPGTFPPPG